MWLTYASTRTDVHVRLYLYVYTCALCVYIYICLYIYTHSRCLYVLGGLPIHLCETDLLTSRQHMSLGHLVLVDELVRSGSKQLAHAVVSARENTLALCWHTMAWYHGRLAELLRVILLIVCNAIMFMSARAECSTPAGLQVETVSSTRIWSGKFKSGPNNISSSGPPKLRAFPPQLWGIVPKGAITSTRKGGSVTEGLGVESAQHRIWIHSLTTSAPSLRLSEIHCWERVVVDFKPCVLKIDKAMPNLWVHRRDKTERWTLGSRRFWGCRYRHLVDNPSRCGG